MEVKLEKVCMMKKYSVIAVASLLATNLLTFPSSSLAEIENKTRNNIEALQSIHSDRQSELQKQLEVIQEQQMELEKRKDILKQQAELFIKVDELKQKKEELLKQGSEDKGCFLFFYNEIFKRTPFHLHLIFISLVYSSDTSDAK